MPNREAALERDRRRREQLERLRQEEKDKRDKLAEDQKSLTDSELTDLRSLVSESPPVGMGRAARRKWTSGYSESGGYDGSGNNGEVMIQIRKVHIGIAVVFHVAGLIASFAASNAVMQNQIKDMKEDIAAQKSANVIIMEKLTRMETDIRWIVRERGQGQGDK